MFLYFADKGRYWLKAMVATWVAFICLSALSPAISLAASDPMTDWSQTSTNKEIFKPWMNSGPTAMPWDGNWKAFNSTMSERSGGTCALNESDQKSLTTFRAGAEADYKIIQDRNSSGDPAFKDDKIVQKFRDALKYRLGTNPSGKLGDGNDLGNGKANMRLLFTPSTINNITDIDSLQSLISSSPNFSACTQIHSTWDNLKHNVFPNPIVLFKEPARFIVQLIAFIPTTLATVTYTLVSSAAFGMLLSTPHSERGDTIFNSISYQAANGVSGKSQLTALVGANSKGSSPGNTKTCSQSANKYSKTDAELGFACQNLNSSNQSSNAWIGIANGLRATLSAVYGIIVVGVALIYLFKRNAQSQYNLKVVMPRLFFAVLLSTSAPYLIGAVISMSNFILQSILSVQQGSLPAELHRSVVGLMDVKYGAGLGGIVDALVSILVPMCVLTFFSFCLLYFIFIAISKQIALAALIIMTPVACLSFVFRDSGKNLLALWAKGIAGISAIPIAVASVLVLGIQVANVFWNPSDTGYGAPGLSDVGNGLKNGGLGQAKSMIGADGFMSSLNKLLAVAVLCVAMTMSMKMIGKIRQWVTGSKTGMVGKGLGTATKIGGLVAGTAATLGGNPALAGAITQATSAAGNRMRNGGGDKKWLPSSSSTFGSATATPGKDLTSSAGRALGSFSKMRSMDRLADAAENPGSGRDTTPQIESATQDSSNERSQTNVDASATSGSSAHSNTTAPASGSASRNDIGKGLGEMQRLGGTYSKKALGAVSSVASHLPLAGTLKNALTSDAHGGAIATLAATAIAGPVGGAIAFKKFQGRREAASQQAAATTQAAVEAAAQASAQAAQQEADTVSAGTSGFGSEVGEDFMFPVTLGEYGGNPAADAAGNAAAAAQTQAARDRALSRRQT